MRAPKHSWHLLATGWLLFLLSACLLRSVPTPTNEGTLVFPESAGAPPEDILDQIAVFGGGGEDAKPGCAEIRVPCIELIDDQLFIRGESSYQELKIVAYEFIDDGYNMFRYYSEWVVKLGADNTLRLNIQNRKTASVFLAYDPKTGKLVSSSMDFNSAEDAIKQKNESRCPPGTETQLCIGCVGRIINDHIRGNGLPNGTLFDIINGPSCIADSVQWYVEIRAGQFPVVRKLGSEFWKITLDGRSFLRAAGHTWIFEQFHGEWLAEKAE